MVVFKCPECGEYKSVYLNSDNDEEIQDGNDMYCENCDTYFDSNFDADSEEL